jgi:hypothetical protein
LVGKANKEGKQQKKLDVKNCNHNKRQITKESHVKTLKLAPIKDIRNKKEKVKRIRI